MMNKILTIIYTLGDMSTLLHQPQTRALLVQYLKTQSSMCFNLDVNFTSHKIVRSLKAQSPTDRLTITATSTVSSLSS